MIGTENDGVHAGGAQPEAITTMLARLHPGVTLCSVCLRVVCKEAADAEQIAVQCAMM